MELDARIPSYITELKGRSAALRGRVMRGYASVCSAPVKPSYLCAGDIVASHMQRSRQELARRGRAAPDAAGHYAFTRAMAGGRLPGGAPGALSEVCVGVMAGVLNARGSLHVAAGFFSAMVACIDDYLDREGSYEAFGGRLLFISHAYRDLMDMALDGAAGCARISEAERHGIRLRLYDVIRTLAGSESASGAMDYLYQKSCGDKVIGVLFPASSEGREIKQRCAGIGRLVGEAGQLIDDIIDCESDRAAGRRNYILSTGAGTGAAIAEARRRVSRARALARGLKDGEAVCWVLDSLDEVTGILKGRERSKERICPDALGLSSSLKALLPEGLQANQFLVWF